MLSTAITLCLISAILPLVLKANGEEIKDNGDKIIFEFGKKIKICMLLSTIIFVIMLIACIIALIFNNDKDALSVIAIFSMFTLLCSFVYIFTRNKKVIYFDNTFYNYNIFGKKSVFKIVNAKEAIEKQSDGMLIIFNDGRKLKVDVQMINYSRLKDLLDKNNIVYKDKNGNNAPKGW